jgi:hypothetical protein
MHALAQLTIWLHRNGQFDADKKNNSGGKKKSIGIHCVAGLGRYKPLCV